MSCEWDPTDEIRAYNQLSAEEKKRDLFDRQRRTLELFLASGAISRAQYDQSLREMRIRMGFEDALQIGA